MPTAVPVDRTSVLMHIGRKVSLMNNNCVAACKLHSNSDKIYNDHSKTFLCITNACDDSGHA